MRRLWILLALIVAVSSTPLRLVEAANDLARPLSGNAGLDEIDGGVGDEAAETIRADVADETGVAVDVAAWWCSMDPPPQPPRVLGAGESSDRPAERSRNRYLLLECFRC